MRPRIRKLIGTVFLAVFVPFYALVAMTIAAAKLPGTSVLIQTLFFAVVGLAWVIPAGAVIYWMQRPRIAGRRGRATISGASEPEITASGAHGRPRTEQ